MTITTKSGDKGKTQLFGGKKIKKSSNTIGLIGKIDKLQAIMGIVKNQIKDRPLNQKINDLQKQLYYIMSELAGSGKIEKVMLSRWIEEIERSEQKMEKKIILKKNFYLPGINNQEVWLNYLRTEVRSCERLVCVYSEKRKEAKKLIPYFNRLSDYFFVLSQFFLK